MARRRPPNLAQLTRQHGHQKVYKCHPVKEFRHLNRNPNQTDLDMAISVRQNLLEGKLTWC